MSVRRHELLVECEGDPAPLHAFVEAVAGSGFVDWPDLDPAAGLEGLEATLIADGAPRAVAWRVASDTIRWAKRRQDLARLEAERLPGRQPLDLAAIVPVPARVLAGGLRAGRRWMRAAWGMKRPLTGPVDLHVAQEIRNRRGPKSAKRPSSWTVTRARYVWYDDQTPRRALELLALRNADLAVSLAIDGQSVTLGTPDSAARALSIEAAIDALREAGWSVERAGANLHRAGRGADTKLVSGAGLRRLAADAAFGRAA